MKVRALVLFLLVSVSTLVAQLAGPNPGPNVGDFVTFPMLVAPTAITLLPGGTQALLRDEGRLKILDLSTQHVQFTPAAGMNARSDCNRRLRFDSARA